jgi:hypothetical protein
MERLYNLYRRSLKNKFKASPVLNIIPFSSPKRRGLGRGQKERGISYLVKL